MTSNINNSSRETRKFNIFVLFYGMIYVQIILITVHVYIPVFLFNTLNVDRESLALSQILSYSAFLLQPLISLYFDKKREKTNLIIFLSVLCSAISYALFVVSLNSILLLGIFLGITFALVSILDVAIDKVLVVNSTDERVKSRNIQYKQLGGMIGAVIPNILFLVFMGDVYEVSDWNLFFFSGFSLLVPFIIIIVFFKLNKDVDSKETEETEHFKIPRSQFFIMCLAVFLLYSDSLYEYPLEPWIVEKFGQISLQYYSLALIIFILIDLISVIAASSYIKRKGEQIRKKSFTIAIAITGILHFFIPFSGFWGFIGIVIIFQILFGFLIVNLLSYMTDVSKKQVLYYELMTAFIFIGKVVFIPLGTYLSGIANTEILFVIVGILYLCSLLAIIKLDDEKIKDTIPK